ncbi:hypothetical protein EMCRGX_G032897 [Ephydatia muelleri]|eukprot:Em0019g1026a
MAHLTTEQTANLEISQFREFLSTYNHVTAKCFNDCVHDFTSRVVSSKEADCAMLCVDKYIKLTQRVSIQLQQHYQAQDTTGSSS